jgi:hypothetical protein
VAGKQGEHMQQVIQQFVDAPNLTALRIAFSKLCTEAGEVDALDVLLHGSYGEFFAFCMVKMKSGAAADRLLRQFGFQQIGNWIYLPRALPREFERRALARVA